jgi:glycogen phosphorylase
MGVWGSRARSGVFHDKLERILLSMFYRELDSFLRVMLHAIALNGSFFNAHRMVKQYILNAYAHL